MKFFKNITFFIILILNFFYINSVSAIILASIKPLTFIVKAIANNIVPVETLLPYNASEHNYLLRPSDLKKIKTADLLIWIGPDIESFLTKIAFNLPIEKNFQISNFKKLIPDLIFQKTDFKKDNIYKKNMHIWLSPKIGEKIAFEIYLKLLKMYPNKKINLKNNFQNFQKCLLRTHKNILTLIEPIKYKKYYVFHNAFIYFEKYYGLLFSEYIFNFPEEQISVKKLNKIKNIILKNKIKCIFFEPQSFLKNGNFFFQNTFLKYGLLDPLGMNIKIEKNSYCKFLLQISYQYLNCLKNFNIEG